MAAAKTEAVRTSTAATNLRCVCFKFIKFIFKNNIFELRILFQDI